MRRTARVWTASACAAVLLAGCGGHPAEPEPAHAGPPRGPSLAADFSGSGPGTLVSAEGLVDLDPQLRAATSVSARIVYVSTSGINDSHALVSATVFAPSGPPPPDGWRIVALAHDATGIEPECAPSASPTLLGMAARITPLVEAGYLVVATDYQGLGLRGTDRAKADETIGPFNGYHPFLDSTTEGYNVIDSVRAARKLVPTASANVIAWGTGQGGQAVWAANELAADYGGTLRFLGVVTDAPTVALDWLADGAARGDLTKQQAATLQQFLAATGKEYGDFDVDPYRHGVVKDDWDALSSCWGPSSTDRDRLIQQIGPGDLRPDTPDATQVLLGYLRKTSLPQARALAPMLVIPDAPDGLIPQPQTDTAIARACALGDDIVFGVPHDPADPTEAMGWIADQFNGAAGHDDCPASASADPA
ncbi:lipase family protein [Mycolicibacterium sp.]|uniref:lipase family protein n=1 Tax=Mycolicibacterium sp. TaxID=2320850 RepID=UPI001A1DAD99|nr:lipase family protein [Mycolicibacterium sp.]MBJ7340593.1 lipase [Mycolicibacterium sp.]